MTAQQRILLLLAKERHELLSISDIAKLLKIAYSHAYKYIQILKQQQVIQTKRVGGAYICTLNFKEPLTRALLAQLSYIKAQEWRKKNPHAKKILQRIDEFKEHLSIVAMHNKRTLILPSTPVNLSKFHNHKIITPDELKSDYYKDIIILYGAEKYWELV